VGGVSATAQSLFHFCQHQHLKNGKQPKKQNKTKQNKTKQKKTVTTQKDIQTVEG